MNLDRQRQRSRGVSLIEAMVALAVMAFGMLGVGVMQSSLRLNADIARQRAEATRLAAESIEQARAYALVNTDPLGVKRAYADIVSVAATDMAGTNATFQRTVTVTNEAAMRYLTVHVQVTWKDRTNTDQDVRLSTTIHRAPPELSASLIVPGVGVASQNPDGRHSSIPRGAVDNGDGTSTFAPPGAGAVRWVFNNSTGFIRSRCDGTCATAYGRYLQGYIAFDLTAPTIPDLRGESPASNALSGVDVTVAQTFPTSPAPARTPECFTELLPPSPAVARVVAYYCAVYVSSDTGTNSRWSGRSELSGLTLSTSSADANASAYKVCRYTPYLNNNAVGTGTPAITNVDHPYDYALVDRNLINQNFLVIKSGDGSLAYDCPDDVTSTPLVFGRTWRHQPST